MSVYRVQINELLTGEPVAQSRPLYDEDHAFREMDRWKASEAYDPVLYDLVVMEWQGGAGSC